MNRVAATHPLFFYYQLISNVAIDFWYCNRFLMLSQSLPLPVLSLCLSSTST